MSEQQQKEKKKTPEESIQDLFCNRCGGALLSLIGLGAGGILLLKCQVCGMSMKILLDEKLLEQFKHPTIETPEFTGRNYLG